MNRKRLLLTGASGLLGKSLEPAFRDAGYAVRPVVGPRTASPFSTDLTDERRVNALFQAVEPEIVVHAAAKIFGVAGQQIDMTAPVTDNVVLGARVLEACVKYGVWEVCLISSSTVYPASALDGVTDEYTPPNPDPIYGGVGNVKLFLEKLARFYSQKTGRKLTIVRPTALYGVHDHFDKTAHVIPQLVNRVLAGERPLRVWGLPTVTRDFVHADDAARGVLVAMEAGGTHNVSTGVPVTIQDLANLIWTAVHKKPPEPGDIVFDPSMPMTIPHRVASSRKLQALGWKPEVSLEQGIQQVVESRRG